MYYNKKQMPRVKKVVRYSVTKNGHTTLFKKKSAAHKRVISSTHRVHHKRRKRIV